jgi:hypothetical protein
MRWESGDENQLSDALAHYRRGGTGQTGSQLFWIDMFLPKHEGKLTNADTANMIWILTRLVTGELTYSVSKLSANAIERFLR